MNILEQAYIADRRGESEYSDILIYFMIGEVKSGVSQDLVYREGTVDPDVNTELSSAA